MGKPFSSALELKYLATPSANPASGALLMYAKADGKVYVKKSDGTEAELGSGGGSGAAVADVQPNEPVGTPEGHLWYDSDDESGGLDPAAGDLTGNWPDVQIANDAVSLENLAEQTRMAQRSMAYNHSFAEESSVFSGRPSGWKPSWGGGGSTIIQDLTNSMGPHTARMDSNGTEAYLALADKTLVPVTPGQRWRVAYRLHTSVTLATPDQFMFVSTATTADKIEAIFDSGNEWLSTATTIGSTDPNGTRVETTFTIPANRFYMSLYLRAPANGGTPYSAWFDDVVLEEVGPEGGAEPLAAAFRGAYSGGMAYSKGDIVNLGSKTYVATEDIPAGVAQWDDPILVHKSLSVKNSGSHQLTIPNDGSVVVGDLMVAVYFRYNYDAVPLISGGAGAWFSAYSASQSSTYWTYAFVLYRAVEAGDLGATITFDTSYSTSSACDLRVFRSADPAGMLVGSNPVASSTPSTASDFTPGQSQALVTHFWGSMLNSSTNPAITIDSNLAQIHSGAATSYFVAGSGHEIVDAGAVAPVRTATASTTGGFPVISLALLSTWSETPMDSNEWLELPWGTASNPSLTWEVIERKTLSAISANTVGNLAFENIPAKYKRLRLRSSYLSHDSSSAAHLYVRFNQDTTSSYGHYVSYHTTGSPQGVNSTSQSQGMFAYNYFYGGPTRKSTLDVEITNSLSSVAVYKATFDTVMGAASHSYGSIVDGHWNRTEKITRIDLWTSLACNWDPLSTITLYGMVDDD